MHQPPIRAAVLVHTDPRVADPVSARSEQDLLELLQGSGRYQVVETAQVEAWLGMSPERLFARCAQDDACWQEHTGQLGLDQLIAVELKQAGDRPMAHLLLVDVQAGQTLAPRRYRSTLPRAGGAPLDLAEQMFFGPGSLMVRPRPLPAQIEVDQISLGQVSAAYRADPIAAGKHVVRVEAEGHLPLLTTVLVRPGRTTVVDAPLQPLVQADAQRLNWTAWAAVGMVVGGSVAALAVSAMPADAVESRAVPAP